MDPEQPSAFPMSLTRRELEEFNHFWQSLSAQDRDTLYDLIQSASQNRASIDHQGSYFPYQSFLMSLIIEEHKEIMRLRAIVEELSGKNR